MTQPSPSTETLPDTRLRRIWRLGADVDTDLLAPGHVMHKGIDGIAGHCLEAVRPEFAREVRPGDVLVAGPGFGIGSSREQAAAVLRHHGVAAVIAPSYGGLFFRNAFNLGLLLLTCDALEGLEEGAGLRLQLGVPPRLQGADGDWRDCEPVPGFLLDMVRHGGLLNQLRQRNLTEPTA